jgi:hypothetical protein
VVADPADDPVLDAAVTARVDYLVTGDKALLAVKEYGGVKIVTARAFFDLLIAEGDAQTGGPDASYQVGLGGCSLASSDIP